MELPRNVKKKIKRNLNLAKSYSTVVSYFTIPEVASLSISQNPFVFSVRQPLSLSFRIVLYQLFLVSISTFSDTLVGV